MTFIVDPRLQQGSHFIKNFPLTQLWFKNCSDIPWFVLIPQVPNMRDMTDLSTEQQHQLLEEINSVGLFLKKELGASKLNVASLGNVVSQLHLHVIGRFENDAHWPHPVWGRELKEDAKKIEMWLKKIKSFPLFF